MAESVADFPEYMSDVHGVLSADDTPLLFVEYDVKWVMTTVDVERPGASALELPTMKRKVTTKIKKAALVTDDPEILMGYSMTDTPISGASTSLASAATFTADTVITLGNPATPSRVRIAVSVAAITTAGEVIVYGTDNNDNKISEVISIPLGADGQTFDGAKVFKTTTHAAIVDLVGSGAKLAFNGILGSSTFTFGNPKVFTLTGLWTHPNGSTLQVEQPGCYMKSGGASIASTKPIPVDIDVAMHDPDLLEVTTTPT